jgi:hypothetical protein
MPCFIYSLDEYSSLDIVVCVTARLSIEINSCTLHRAFS